jgi:pimeloyl-ACP methyl ester carboxylesterase
VTAATAAHEAGQGPAVVLLHAFPLSAQMWSAQRTALAERHRVVTPDTRGFGASPLGADEPSLDRCADDLAALLDRLQLDRVVLGGLSMGGYITMAFLRRHADRVRGLVLADTKAAADPDAGRASRLRMAEAVEREGAAVLVREVLPALVGGTTKEQRPDVVARVQDMVEAAPPQAAAWAQRAMAARSASWDVLGTVAVPALVLVGDEDALSPVADARAMADALPRGRLVVLPGAGHLSAMEVPEAFTRVLTGFLEDLGD